jgi:hypothetical protein
MTRAADCANIAGDRLSHDQRLSRTQIYEQASLTLASDQSCKWAHALGVARISALLPSADVPRHVQDVC